MNFRSNYINAFGAEKRIGKDNFADRERWLLRTLVDIGLRGGLRGEIPPVCFKDPAVFVKRGSRSSQARMSGAHEFWFIST